MSALAEAQMLVQGIAGERGSSKERIRRAAMRVSKLSFNRVRELFYGLDRCHVWAEELDELRRVARVQQEEEAKSEYAELRARLEQLEAHIARMGQAGEDIHCSPNNSGNASLS